MRFLHSLATLCLQPFALLWDRGLKIVRSRGFVGSQLLIVISKDGKQGRDVLVAGVRAAVFEKCSPLLGAGAKMHIEDFLVRETRVIAFLEAHVSGTGKSLDLSCQRNQPLQNVIVAEGGLQSVGRESSFLRRVTPSAPKL